MPATASAIARNYTTRKAAKNTPLMQRVLRRAEVERTAAEKAKAHNLAQYQYEPRAYIENVLGYAPWAGQPGKPGQQEIIDAYTLALQQQHEKEQYEAGALDADAMQYWTPGEPIQNRIRVEAGHNTGKTFIGATLVNHFFDCFTPAIVYTFAPTWTQIKDLLWKEIRTQRDGKGLPGRILETCELKYRPNHFAKGRAAGIGDNATERIQGQHGRYLMFVLDEAEGVAPFVFDAVNSMTSGGISIVLMLANPRTRGSSFYAQRTRSDVANFRMSCLHHPNVIHGREVVPNAVKRDYVIGMLDEGHAVAVEEHDPDNYTFELPWQPGKIFQPDDEFMFRVLGVAPPQSTDDTFCPMGRFEAACERPLPAGGSEKARMGVDVARYGSDVGTLYVEHAGAVRRAGVFKRQDYYDYYIKIRSEAERLKAQGVTDLQIRVDGGGGFGGGVVSHILNSAEFTDKDNRLFPEFKVFEVHFGGVPYDGEGFRDIVTEMYYHAGEACKHMAVLDATQALQQDVTERSFRWVKSRRGKDVKALVDKEQFRRKFGRSPDDGDGFVLAVAPDHLFRVDPAKRHNHPLL